jgi:hypothetical protein
MNARRKQVRVRKLSGVLAATALMTTGLVGLSAGAPGVAGADGASTVCGPLTTLTPNANPIPPSTSPPPVTPESLTVPQYNGSDLTGVQLSLKFSHTFGPSMYEFPEETPAYTAAASGDNVLVEMSGPGLPPLGSYVDTAPTGNAGFTYSGASFSAGDPAPALPTGLVASSDSDGIAVETSSGQVDPSWNGLGFGLPQILAAPWATEPAAIVTADDSATLNSTEQTQSVTDFSDYEGAGSVPLSAAYFNAGLHSYGTGSNVAFGSTDSMSVQACATYTVLGAQTPEAPSTLLLPGAAVLVGLGAFLVVRRRHQRLGSN